MFKNYIKIAIRNLVKNKIFTFINIFGLAVGICCFIILSLYVLDEVGHDRFNKNADQIYRIYTHTRLHGEEANNSKTPALLGITLLKDYPEVINYTRIGYFGQHSIRYKDKAFREGSIYTVDSTYFSMFTFPFIYGDPKTALKNPYSVVITEKTAKKYFGNENPLGKTFIVDDTSAYLITGVMKNFPDKSHFRCNFLLSMSTYPITTRNDWLNSWYTTYIELRKGTSPKEFDKKLQDIVQQYTLPEAEKILGMSFKDFKLNGNTYEFHLQPLTSIYLYSQEKYNIDPNTEWSGIKSSNFMYSEMSIAIAAFILLIAIFNFMNLSTAKSEKRGKEVGIRKTLGSTKFMLIKQFIVESTIICFSAVIISIALTEIALPLFNSFVDREIKFELFNNYYTLPALILFTIIVGLISGSYPAFYLSSFQPAEVLKSDRHKGYRKNFVRSTLVIIQFSISIALIIATIIIKSQLDYLQNKNLGFNKENLITINNSKSLGDKVDLFKENILRNSNVISATTSSLMFQSGIPGSGILYNKTAGTDVVSCQFLDVDYDFLKTFHLKIKEGRFFSKDFPSDTSMVVINEEAAKEFHAVDPVGKILASIDASKSKMDVKRIIGVVKNFNYESLHQKIRPLVFYLSPVTQAASVTTIRVNSRNLPETIKYIENTWHKYVTKEKLNWTFLDQNLARMYSAEEKIGIITTVFSVLAVIIACLGLFGLISFVTEQRTKEIGIRKVLGASVTEILIILSKEITVWVMFANLLAWPVAYLFMEKWLKDFAYRINISPVIFVLSGIIALVIALMTVSYQAINAALANPVKSLRYE